MKRLLLFVLLLLPLLSEGQAGYLNLNDFGPPTYPYPYSRYWLRGTPVGTVPIFTIHGTLSYIIHTDTVFIPALALRDDATPYRLVWIDSNGMLRAITPLYVQYTDTASMLSPYLRIIDTTGHWAPKLPYLLSESDPVWVAASSNYFTKTQSDARYLQTYTETDPLSVHVSDSASMLSPYIRAAQAATIYYPLTNPSGYITSAAITGKLNISDTASMLSPYIRVLNASQTYYPLVANPAGYLTSASITGKLNISDTAAMLLPYAKIFQLVPKVNIADTNSMLSPYIKGFQLALKVNISDTASMLAPYLRKIDTTAMLSKYLRAQDTTGRWAFKANYLLAELDPLSVHLTDSAAMLSKYLRKQDTIYIQQRINLKVNISDTASMLSPYLKSFQVRRQEPFLGTTDGSGNYTVTYGTAYPATPDVQPQLQAGTPSQVVRITASSTTGFTVNVTNRASVTILGIDVLLATTTAVSGASVSVLVTAR